MSQDKRILIEKIIDGHNDYRSQTLNLSASENMVSPTVRKYLASDLGNRYSTYYDDPAERNYTGQKTLIDILVRHKTLSPRGCTGGKAQISKVDVFYDRLGWLIAQKKRNKI